LAEHTATEESLHKEAEKLMHTVKLGISDVQGLHAKLDRKKMVEAYNRQTADGFKQVGNKCTLTHSVHVCTLDFS